MAINKRKSLVGKNVKEDSPKKVPAALASAGGSNKKKSVKELTKTDKKSPVKNGSASQNGSPLKNDGSKKKKRPRRGSNKNGGVEDKLPASAELLAKREEAKKNAITYLDTWENNKSEWRFIKNVQNWLIIHLNDVKMVPESSFDIALKYFSGAVGNARIRLSESSLATIKKLEALDELSEEDKLKLDRAQRIVKLSVNETKAKKQEKTPTKAAGKPPTNRKTPGKTPQKVAQTATPKSAKKTPKK